MTDWKEIVSQDDIDQLLALYGDFHDSCIASLSYKSGAFVDDGSANYPSFSIANGNLKNLNYALQECVNFT